VVPDYVPFHVSESEEDAVGGSVFPKSHHGAGDLVLVIQGFQEGRVLFEGTRHNSQFLDDWLNCSEHELVGAFVPETDCVSVVMFVLLNSVASRRRIRIEKELIFAACSLASPFSQSEPFCQSAKDDLFDILYWASYLDRCCVPKVIFAVIHPLDFKLHTFQFRMHPVLVFFNVEIEGLLTVGFL
jgi:hypothetical protein